MPLAAGTSLGPYEITAAIGKGGMGEVYRARDTRLGRSVAIKILPPHLGGNEELRRRFEWEARIISSLNHPHICTLYDIGHDGGVAFLVMEYLEGETLARRLERGLLPLDLVLAYAMEIADALNKAHRYGVAHRDVKPGNIMLTKSGTKLLDFGLAKSTVQPATVAVAASGGESTATALTVQGAILGTLEYMAPEQLEGRSVDSRTDVFALGCVIFEMATGRRAFEGGSTSSVIAAVLEREPPPVSSLRSDAPPALDRVVKLCLTKDPEVRWQDTHDLMLQLQAIGEERAKAESRQPARPVGSREYIAWAISLLLLFTVLVLVAASFRATPSHPGSTCSFIPPPEHTRFRLIGDYGGPPAISRDGGMLAFVAVDAEGRSMLWVRPLNARQAQPLSGTEGATFPFWSPAGDKIGFFADGKLKTIAISGGPPLAVCDARNGRGGSWSRDGTIIFSPGFRDGIYRVSEQGGEAVPVTKPDNDTYTSHRWPHFLPDGQHFLYLAGNHAKPRSESTGVFRASLDGKEAPVLLLRTASEAMYASGHLLFVRLDGTLAVQGFDAGRGRLTGEAVPTTEQVYVDRSTWKTLATASETGILAYHDAGSVMGSELLWLDSSGKLLDSLGSPSLYVGVRLSPNGQRLAVVSAEEPTWDVRIYEVARGIPSRFSSPPGDAANPVWSPNGSRVAYASSVAEGTSQLFEKESHGGAEQRLLETTTSARPTDWSSNGFILYNQEDESNPTAGNLGPRKTHVWVLRYSDKRPFPFLHTKQLSEFDGQFSPDGKWVAYCSAESGKEGREVVYIAPFSGTGPRESALGPRGEVHPAITWPVAQGTHPKWSRDGKRLFFLAGMRLMAAEILVKGGAIVVGTVRALFPAPLATSFGNPASEGWPYDVSSTNEERFLINAMRAESGPALTLVTNWTERAGPWTPRVFIRPQFDYHWVNNFFQFGSNSVPQFSASVGYSFGEP
jgi:serine/threonine protein kinase/Tol biopolymer transport system component